MCHFKNKRLFRTAYQRAFSLIEVMAALMILAIISSSVVVVVNRNMKSAIDSRVKMEAFELARENMEILLASDSVSEMIESGTSEKNPAIWWQNMVESFYEPHTSRMWIRAVCSSGFTDYDGQQQTVELTHWLTDLSKQQMLGILKENQEQLDEEGLEDEFQTEYFFVDKDESGEGWILFSVSGDKARAVERFDTKDEALQVGQIEAVHLDVDLEENIDRFVEQVGSEETANANKEIETLLDEIKPDSSDTEAGSSESEQESSDDIDSEELILGYTQAQLNAMSFEEVWAILSEYYNK